MKVTRTTITLIGVVVVAIIAALGFQVYAQQRQLQLTQARLQALQQPVQQDDTAQAGNIEKSSVSPTSIAQYVAQKLGQNPQQAEQKPKPPTAAQLCERYARARFSAMGFEHDKNAHLTYQYAPETDQCEVQISSRDKNGSFSSSFSTNTFRHPQRATHMVMTMPVWPTLCHVEMLPDGRKICRDDMDFPFDDGFFGPSMPTVFIY